LNSRMRIIVFANTIVYENQLSGGDRVFVELSKHLNQRDYEIRVVTTSVGEKLWHDGGANVSITKVHSFSFEQLIGRGAVPLLYALRSILGLVRTYKLLASDRPTILYSSSDFAPDTLPPFVIKFLGRDLFWISRVYHLIVPPTRRRGNPLTNLLSFASQRASLILIKRRADLIIGLNPALCVELTALGIPKSRLATSGAGIDIMRIDSAESSDEKRYDGVILGRVHPNKGFFDALEIWKLVLNRRSDAKLAIIGGGERQSVDLLKSKIRENNLEGNIDYYGYIENDMEVYRILKSSKLFLSTDHESGWSLAACEAMACQLPVVAYDLKIFGTVFEDGFVTVPIFDNRRFADSILGLLDDDTRRIELGKAARRQAERFSWQKVADEFSELIRTYGKLP
jgi:glycosyltransferase involved in cell wall biosynthesis